MTNDDYKLGLCADCEEFVHEKKLDDHTKRNPTCSVFLSVPSLLPSWTYETRTININDLKITVRNEDRHHVTMDAINSVKEKLKCSEADYTYPQIATQPFRT